MRSDRYKIIFSIVFAIAMAYLEAVVVVYLRELYYPNGFSFPLVLIPDYILLIEIGREIATIIMLWAIAMIAGTDSRSVFAYFALNFGVWDIWYYIWLKATIGWPATILDWDVLFLIPLPWIGPVLAPLIVSCCLIVAGLIMLRYESMKLKPFDWFAEISCGLLIIISFTIQSPEVIPQDYDWWLFFIGLGIGLFVFLRRLYQHLAPVGH